MKIHEMTAAEAIVESIARDEIVHIAAIGAVQAELAAACEDYDDYDNEAEEGDRIFSYWGTDKDNNNWRVSVHHGSGH